MNRKEAREFLMKVLFQMDATEDFSPENAQKYLSGKFMGGQKNYCNLLLGEICGNRDEIDNLISKFSTGWRIERMPKTDISILRLSVGEILYSEDVPAAVSINEAVELAKKYGTQQSPKFVNAVLGSISGDASKTFGNAKK